MIVTLTLSKALILGFGVMFKTLLQHLKMTTTTQS